MLPNTGPLWTCAPTAVFGLIVIRRTSTRWTGSACGSSWFMTTTRLIDASTRFMAASYILIGTERIIDRVPSYRGGGQYRIGLSGEETSSPGWLPGIQWARSASWFLLTGVEISIAAST